MMTDNTSPHIGTLAEKSLHADLKAWVEQPNDQIEVRVDGFVIDIVRSDLLIEIQTRNFSGIKRKLQKLLDKHQIHLLHPIAQEKWIVRQTTDGELISRRKSPKRGRIEDIFNQLIYVPPCNIIGVVSGHTQNVTRLVGYINVGIVIVL